MNWYEYIYIYMIWIDMNIYIYMIGIDMIWWYDDQTQTKHKFHSRKGDSLELTSKVSTTIFCERRQKPNHNYIHEATSITQSQWASCKTSIQTSNTFKCTAIHCNPLPSIAIQASNSNMPWCLTVSSPKASSCIRKTRPKPTVRLGEKHRSSMGEIRRARSTSSTPSKPHLGP